MEPAAPNSNWRYYLLPAAIVALALFLVVSDFGGCFSRASPVPEGQAAMANQNYVKAIRQFSEALRLCETDIAARYLLGAAYHNYGWQDEALTQYDATWNLAVNNAVRAMHSAGRIWYRRGDMTKAIACFRRALALNPASPDIWFELGTACRQAGQAEAASSAFQEAVRWEPANPDYQGAAAPNGNGQTPP